MAADPIRTRVIRAPGVEWERAVASLEASGSPVPLPVRPEWAREIARGAAWLVVAEDGEGRCQAACALEVTRMSALPGHRVARGHHLGIGLAGEVGAAVIGAIGEAARRDPFLLRVNLELLVRDSDARRRLGRACTIAGFRPVEHARSYRDTIVIDLAGTKEDILARFSTTTRRDLRHWSERPVEMRAIADARYAERLNLIARETFARTGGRWEPRDWPARIRLCVARPNESRLVGLFRAGRDDPDALLAYAWGCAHGDYAHYDDAGSTRVDDIKVSLSYPLMWDLIRWARANGCAWFDMGGIPSNRDPNDPRAGIADFKRRFSKIEVTVGEEWVLETHPVRARIAAALGRVVRLLGR